MAGGILNIGIYFETEELWSKSNLQYYTYQIIENLKSFNK